MTTSVVFDDIDYSEIEYDSSTNDENMLTDPSASIIALQGLRVLKTRETGDDVVIPDTTGRSQVTMIDFDQTNYYQYKMRRKAEVLKYKQNTTTNKRTQFSALATSRRGKISNSTTTISNCENDVIRVKRATNSGIQGDDTLLFYDKSVSFIDNL